MRLAWSSIATLAIAPLQDLLNLGGGSRMNVPGQAGGNWRWRVTEDAMSPQVFEWVRELTEDLERCEFVPSSGSFNQCHEYCANAGKKPR